MEFEYGNAHKRHNMAGEIYLPNNSTVKVCDWIFELPEFMLRADVLFIDPPWNKGQVKGFYTKAQRPQPVFDFDEFSQHLFNRVLQINPKEVFFEIGAQHVKLYADWCGNHFQYVHVYESTYYHKKSNRAFIVHGCSNYNGLGAHLNGLDEEDAIKWICKNHEYGCIGDLCMGRGLVGKYAYLSGRSFVSTELNFKRLAVLIDFIKRQEIG